MNKYACVRDCQIRLSAKSSIRYILADEVVTAEENPNERCFRLIGAEEVNFGAAKEEELMSSKWRASDLVKFASETYSIDIKYDDKTSKSELVAALLDARFRHVDSTHIPTS